MTEPARPRIRSHRDLIVWQKSMELVDETYNLTEPFPPRELYGLSSQMRRAAVSIPGNIAEGQARNTTKDFLYFLAIARGSLRELDTYFDVSQRRGYVSDNDLRNARSRIEVVGKLHTALCAALRRKLRLTP